MVLRNKRQRTNLLLLLYSSFTFITFSQRSHCTFQSTQIPHPTFSMRTIFSRKSTEFILAGFHFSISAQRPQTYGWHNQATSIFRLNDLGYNIYTLHRLHIITACSGPFIPPPFRGQQNMYWLLGRATINGNRNRGRCKLTCLWAGGYHVNLVNHCNTNNHAKQHHKH